MHPVLRAIRATLLAQVAVAAGTLLLLRLLALQSGTDGFAAYSLVRQAVTLLFPVVTVGLAGGLPRYIALGRATAGAPTAQAYVAAAAIICALAVAVSAGFALLAPAVTAAALFGGSDATSLVGPFAALMCATAAFHVAYGYFRGQLQIGRCNALQVVGVGVLPPLLMVVIPGGDVETLVLAMALGLGVLSIGAVLVPVARGVAHAHAARRAAGSLIDYGSRRVPGEVAQVGLFALVPVLAAHVTSLQQVAYLAAGVQIVAMLAVGLVPVGIVLLPTLAQTWVEDPTRVKRQVADLCGLAAHAAAFAFVQLLLFADVAIRAWLGPAFEDAGTVVRITILGAPLFAYYLILRTSLDAVSVKSYNARSNIVALASFAAVAAILLSLEVAAPAVCVAWAFTTGIAVQGLLTMRFVHRIFGVRGSDYSLATAVPLALLVAALGLAARPLILAASPLLAWLVVLELGLAGAYFGALWRAGVPWARALALRLKARDELAH
jgi:O-antigen/teichoic acid export membrane protein